MTLLSVAVSVDADKNPDYHINSIWIDAGKCLDKQLEQEAGLASKNMLLGLPAKLAFLF